MAEKKRFVLEERPESEVYRTDSGFIGIRQRLRGEESVVLFTPEETVKIIGYLRDCLATRRKPRAAGPFSRKGRP